MASTVPHCIECKLKIDDKTFGLQYKSSFYEDSKCHICHNLATAQIDKEQFQIAPKSASNADEFWSVFGNKRQYRKSGRSLRFFIDIHVLCQAKINKPFTKCKKPILCDECPANKHHINLRKISVSDLHSIYIENKEKIKDSQIVREFEHFFKYYQYGDVVDYSGYRNCYAFCIGFSGNITSNINLRFVPFWQEYGQGLPLEFGDSAKSYNISGYHARFRLMDPLRIVLTENKKMNNSQYFYIKLMQEIVTTQKNVNEYIFNVSGWISRQSLTFFKIWMDTAGHDWYAKMFDVWGSDGHELLSMYMTYHGWVTVFDIQNEQRRNKITNYVCECQCLNRNILKIIADFAISEFESQYTLDVDIDKWKNSQFLAMFEVEKYVLVQDTPDLVEVDDGFPRLSNRRCKKAEKIYFGICKSFSKRKGYGFIKTDSIDIVGDVFVHRNDNDFWTLDVGESVQFNIARYTQNNITAVNVKKRYI